jgi:hypothetical protein
MTPQWFPCLSETKSLSRSALLHLARSVPTVPETNTAVSLAGFRPITARTVRTVNTRCSHRPRLRYNLWLGIKSPRSLVLLKGCCHAQGHLTFAALLLGGSRCDDRSVIAAYSLTSAWNGEPLSYSLGGDRPVSLVLRYWPLHSLHTHKRAWRLVLVSSSPPFVQVPKSQK